MELMVRYIVCVCVQLPAGHVDVSVLVAMQLLIEQVTHEKNQVLLQQLHTHLLFNFNIWNKGDFPLRIGQISVLKDILWEPKLHVFTSTFSLIANTESVRVT